MNISVPPTMADDVQAWLATPAALHRNPTDSQRSKVYNWERTSLPSHLWEPWLDPLGLEEIVVSCCKIFELPIPSIDYRRMTSAGRSQHPRGLLINPLTGMSPLVAIHESAHWVTQSWQALGALYSDKHGPLFARCYAHLLDALLDIPLEDTLNSMLRAGVKAVTATGIETPNSGPSRAGYPRCLFCGKQRYARDDMHFCTHKCALYYGQFILLNPRPTVAGVEQVVSSLNWCHHHMAWEARKHTAHCDAVIWPPIPDVPCCCQGKGDPK